MMAPLPQVLLVEPQFVLRRTIAMVARDLGVVDFHEASSLGRARTLLATHAYAALVLNLDEGAPALQLLGELRQGAFASTPGAAVLVLASAAAPGAGAQLQALGVARVLTKPVRISDLLAALAQALVPGTP